MTDRFRAAAPHGALTEVFSDIFFVTGTIQVNFDGDFQFSRAMTVVRQGESLTIINTVRLDEAGMAALDALGKVEHILKLGSFHGVDDAFYVDRYAAKVWGLAGMRLPEGVGLDHEVGEGDALPIDGASLFVFGTSKMPEALLRLDRDGGVLVAADSLQNWAEVDEYFDEPSKAKMTEMGFIQPANIGPGWLHACSPEASDFARLGALEYRHLLPGHGTPLLRDAKSEVDATIARVLPG